MIRGIHHTSISTGDLERLLRFYRDLLGFEEIFAYAWDVGKNEVADRTTGLKDTSARTVMLKAGNACIELIEFVSPRPKPGDPLRPVCDHGIAHICLEVTELDAEYERLKAAGMLFHCPPQEAGGGSRVTCGRDPDGNVLELVEMRDTKSPMSVKVG